MHTNWAKVEPEKQLANMPHAVKEMLIGTVSKKTITQGKSMYVSYHNREMGTKVHKQALQKVMHGSVNEYFDVTPIGRVI